MTVSIELVSGELVNVEFLTLTDTLASHPVDGEATVKVAVWTSLCFVYYNYCTLNQLVALEGFKLRS